MNPVQQTEEQKTWRPGQDDPNPLVGRLSDVSTAVGEHGPYPLVEIVDDDGCSWSFHAFREVAEKELTELAPEIGDPISVQWLGVPDGKTYHRYRIRFADGRGRKVDWGKFGGTESSTTQPRATGSPASAGKVESAAISQAAEQVERDERDAQLDDVGF